ncbi:MAG: bifunctional DNA-binding transcriptional regulator/O6-methylguanine-DNA methyltransferase Ada [Anaerolineae bacterium]|nr:bifunctional DNA-binding transcriptional regulator/O6-methylguanine-DNA methyltransferase Ada [Anaerolineae bacterium]
MLDNLLESSTRTWNEEDLWLAVLTRDAAWDDFFVYGVFSTRIYCRPTCSSRRPLREKVSFFKTCDEAEAAGYRACKRCHPRQTSPDALTAGLVIRARQLIEEQPEAAFSLDELSRQVGLSPSHLHRLFKQSTGLTPHQYAAAFKLNRFKDEVKTGADLTTALYNAGYSSSSRLYEKASDRLGMTPATYRRGGAGLVINYTVVNVYLGLMLLAATPKGLCALYFGGDETELKDSLQKEYPAASLARNETPLKDWLYRLLRYLDGEPVELNLPLDLQATAFQQRVWQELRRIPAGETRTYAQVAAAIGQPAAVRAVANACAGNPVGVVTPCHRVIRSDGGLGGYRWGIERKEALLAQERRFSKKE